MVAVVLLLGVLKCGLAVVIPNPVRRGNGTVLLSVGFNRLDEW